MGSISALDPAMPTMLNMISNKPALVGLFMRKRMRTGSAPRSLDPILVAQRLLWPLTRTRRRPYLC